MNRKIHLLAAILSTLCIASFLTTTIITELFSSLETIATVKQLVVTPGLYLLIPAMALVGITGWSMGKEKRGRLVNNKQRRMPFIAANGLFVLVPSAIFLAQRATESNFDEQFYIVQSIEVIAGVINLTLMVMNVRDGLKMTGKLNRKSHLNTK